MRRYIYRFVFTACCLLLLLTACGYTQPAGTICIATNKSPWLPATQQSGNSSRRSRPNSNQA